jgi:hypothetical protein
VNVTGTAGAIVYDNATKAMMILSNNHVMANSDSTNNDLGNMGDIIISPGPYDGGTLSDEIGKLDRWVSLNETGPNLFDAACCAVDDPSSVSDVILELGTPKYIQLITSEGMGVVKSGRSSGVTHGVIIDTNASIKVNYPGYVTPFLYNERIITTAMAIAGDSGSLCLTEDLGVVGLVFAGTSTLTAVNKIDGIMKQLNINFNIQQQPVTSAPVAKPNTLIPMVIAGATLLPALF